MRVTRDPSTRILVRMREGHESRTAVLVCAARAMAHGRTEVARFSDPTALALLPEDERARVERWRREPGPPRDLRERLRWYSTFANERIMVPRTVAIDDAIREAALPQLVNLGAGLDGRAFRMTELAGVSVFEVDHPASQATKRARARALTPRARELRWVGVDFARDDLDARLAEAGHDAATPTFWLLEGVVPYLTMPQLEATLAVIARRSAKGSRLAIAYLAPSRLKTLSLLISRLSRPFGNDVFEHEPQITFLRPEEMRALLARHGLRVISDEDLATISARLGAELARFGRIARAGGIAIAER